MLNSNPLYHPINDDGGWPDLTAPATGNRTLPIWDKMSEIIKSLRDNSRLIISSPTGSGKTTQIPQALFSEGFANHGKIYVVENRVVVAAETAKRVAEEMNVALGDVVGYLTGPEKRCSPQAKIIFLTSGVFRQILQRDPDLRAASVVILDEFDERDLLTDLSSSLIEKAQLAGSKVRLVLMSATLNAAKLSSHLGDAPIVESAGRLHPIKTTFLDTPVSERKMPEEIAGIVARIDGKNEPGDILIFCPGKGEIERAAKAIGRLQLDAQILPLHSELPPEERSKVFKPCEQRKIVISTNIAERGVTIDGIVHVIDMGQVRQNQYNPQTDATLLPVVACALDSLEQRKGRAGRTQPGKHYPLLTKEEYDSRPNETAPEIQRLALRDVVLQIKAMGYSRENEPLRFIDAPPKANWKAAKEQLRSLGALDSEDETKLSDFGKLLSELGCGALEAALIAHGSRLGCGHEALTIAAIRMSRRLLYIPKGQEFEAREAHEKFLDSKESDLLNLLSVFKKANENNFNGQWCKQNFVSWLALRDIRTNRQQLKKRASTAGLKLGAPTNQEDTTAIRKALARSCAHRVYSPTSGGRFLNEATDDLRILGRESAVKKGQLLVAHELLDIPRGPKLITLATVIEKDWLTGQ